LAIPTKKLKYLRFVGNTNMKESLIKNVKTFLKSAGTVYKLEDYTSATILYFKAAFAALDYLILHVVGRSPKDHTERFRMLQENFKELYTFLDKSFPIYRKTYSFTIDRETCDWVKKNVEESRCVVHYFI